ncbi:N-acetyltransferase [Streptomyces beigongshangae]|uniref:N-acetyltransferase n=1 Tax=Streptomyces beigongshangae TaxID=2841597 RepID=UPI001C84DF5F|nr:N-acetyltransferase [Streptomyces sp. REN17]
MADVSRIEFGVDSFGDRTRDGRGEAPSHAQAIRAAVSEAVPAGPAAGIRLGPGRKTAATPRRPPKKGSRMTRELTGGIDASMTVELDLADPIGSCTVGRADGTPVGTADFVGVSEVREGRIFFCTEVYQDFGGGKLVELLVSKALADGICENVTVVPLCPMFARRLRVHGDGFVASGGVLRRPVPDDIGVITRAALGEA